MRTASSSAKPTLPGIPQIHQINSISEEGPVSNTTGSEVVYCLDMQGRRWVRKSVGCEGLLAESLSWLLARGLLIPVPDCAINVDPNKIRSWMSRHIPYTSPWDPEFSFQMSNSDDLGKILALDVLVLNEDRNAENILLQIEGTELNMKVWSIDFADALIGRPKEYAARVQELPSVDQLAHGLPFDLIKGGAMLAAQNATSLSAAQLSAYVREACDIAQEPAESQPLLIAALTERCRTAPKLMLDFFDSVGGGR